MSVGDDTPTTTSAVDPVPHRTRVRRTSAPPWTGRCADSRWEPGNGGTSGWDIVEIGGQQVILYIYYILK